MEKLPPILDKPAVIHIPELGPEYENYTLPIGARDFSELNHKLLHHPKMDLTPDTTDDYVGKKYGELTVLALVGCIHYSTGTKLTYNKCYWCRCSCGSIKIVRKTSLTQSEAPTCGCRGVQDLQWRRRQLFSVWKNMHSMCYGKTNISYPTVGALGIQVCEEWKNSTPYNSSTRCEAFLNFERWAYDQGIKEIKSSDARALNLSRIDKTKNFSPDNCVFLSKSDLFRNTRQTRWVTAFGHTFPMIVWSEITHLKVQTIMHRLKIGWPIEDALTTPPYKLPIDDYPAPIIPDECLKYERKEGE